MCTLAMAVVPGFVVGYHSVEVQVGEKSVSYNNTAQHGHDQLRSISKRPILGHWI